MTRPSLPQIPALGTLSPLTRLLPVGVGGAATGLAFHPLFDYQPLIRPVAAATLIPLVLAAVPAAMNRRIPLAVFQVLSGGLWLVSAAVVLSGAVPAPALSGAAFSAAGTGMVNGWGQLLTITLPAPPRAELLVIPFTLTWIAVTAGTELVLRLRAALIPMLPSLAAFIVALALSVPGPGSDTPEAVAFALSGLAALLLRGSRSATVLFPLTAAPAGQHRGSGHARRLLAILGAAAAMLAVTGLGAAAGLGALSQRPALNPRLYWSAPTAQVAELNPLDQVAGWLAQPGQYLFTGQPGGATAWQLAVLDQFNGEQWTSSAQFTPAGLGVPWPPGVSHGTPVTTGIQVGGLSGALLPTAGRPVSVESQGLSVDTSTGMLLDGARLHSGVNFTVTAEPVPSPGAAQLANLGPATGPGTAEYLQLPDDLPAGLDKLAADARYSGRAVDAYQEAAVVERELRRGFVNDPKAPAGAAAGDLNQFFATGTGTTVQFAEAFTLTARILGLPSRLVVGFTRGSRVGTSQRYRVDGGDAEVWSEVEIAGAGWVPFFPTPAPSSHAHGAAVSSGTAGKASAVSRPPAVRPVAVTRSSHRPETTGALPWRLLEWIAVTLIVAAAGCHAALLFLARPVRRHRRRTRGTPAKRIAGAWLDLVEQLADLGVSALPGDTNSAIASRAALASGQRGADELDRLSRLVTATLFDPATHASEGAAAAAWRYRDATRAALRDAATVRRRLRVRAAMRYGAGRPPG